MKTEYLTLTDFRVVLQKRIWPILIGVLIAFVSAFGVGLARPKEYGATAEFYVRNLQSTAFLEKNGLTSSQLAAVQTMAKEYAVLAVESDAFLDELISKYALPLSREALRNMLRATTDSTVILLTAISKEEDAVNAVMRALETEFPLFIQRTAWPDLAVDFTVVMLLRSAPPAVSVSWHPLLLAAVCGASAFLLLYLFFLLCFLFGDRLLDGDEVARALPQMPILGTISQGVDEKESREALYGLRERLSQLGSVWQITSADEAEGSECITQMLTTSCAMASRRVLVIDADLRSDKKNDFFCPDRAPGLADFLMTKCVDTATLIVKTEQLGVFVLPAGRLPTSLCDFPVVARMTELLHTLRSQFDVILAIFPATNTAADAALCASLFDGTLLTAKTKKSRVKALRNAQESIVLAGGKPFGIVLHTSPRKQ